MGVLRVAPFAGETTWSLLRRVAARYAVDAGDLRPLWVWRNQAPRSPGTAGIRADAEILLNRAGQDVLARLCRVDPLSLERALPPWAQGPQVFREPDEDAVALARWQLGSAAHGPVAYGCRPCTARRSGQDQAVMRYRARWRRVCGPHQRWALDAGGGHGLEHLDLHRCPEIAAAQRRWPAVARRAQRAGVEEGAVFAVARAVVCQWWDLALEWEQERIWPARLHQLADGDAGARVLVVAGGGPGGGDVPRGRRGRRGTGGPGGGGAGVAGQRRRADPPLPAQRGAVPGARPQTRPPVAGRGRRGPRQQCAHRLVGSTRAPAPRLWSQWRAGSWTRGGSNARTGRSP